MSTPSLLNIPYLYKAGTLYSQIPESGAGDFTVSRTTTVANRSTRINKDGLIELVNDNVPRLDYPVGGAVNGCPALLVEPSAINICLRSTWEGGGASPTGWSPFTLGGTSTPIASLLGNDSVAYSFSTTASQRVFFSQTITISNATNYTFSFYVESIATGVRIDEIMLFQSGASSVVFVDPDGITISAATVISKIGRYQVRMLSTATSTTIRIGIGVSNNIAGLFALSRPQLEVGSVATSYIPTTTASVTRSAETITNTTASALIGQSEGTIYWDIAAVGGVLTGTGNPQFGVRNSAFTNWIGLTSNGVSNPFRITAQATTGALINYQANITSGKAALAWSSAGLVLYVNGISVATSATNPNFSFSRVDIIGLMTFKANAFELHPNRLTNAQLATLTAL